MSCRNLFDTEDELCNIQWDSVPMDVREWLTGTFARKKEPHRKDLEETATIRTISYAVQTGVLVERKFRTTTSSVGIAYPAEVVETFKDVDNWDFNVFTLNEASEGHGLTFIMCELFSKYDLLSHFKIPVTCLIAFAKALEVGYNKYQNPYHNSIHAIDVTQTVHSIMLHTGIMHSFTDLEILAIFFSTSIHDYEHTGTTNHFHVETRSETALLYNDKSVLENHHVSAAYHLMESEDMNILANLNKEEWRELRRLVIQMVLSTDMSHHFQQMNTLKNCLRCLRQMEREHKSKIMSMIVHAADISHPAKPWELHEKWAKALMEEFFKQGDKEAALGLPISSLCDRQTTNIAESQIGFIDVIVKPIFALLLETLDKIVAPLIHEAAKSPCVASSGESRQSVGRGTLNESTCSERELLAALNVLSFKDQLMLNIQTNRNKWKESQVTTTKESPGTKSKKAKVQVSKGKAEEEKPQKTSKGKNDPPKFTSYCVSPQSPAACHCQLCDSSSLEPMDVSFIVYNASASEVSQPHQDADVMDVTESYAFRYHKVDMSEDLEKSIPNQHPPKKNQWTAGA
ncbi:dual specificity calcium/calmodulin-dependent 3',5'-cyclic nucleotide phosphodiesterase 1A-like [Elgaria multicarinata webbii]|uniref:dual specificity calcium/calmodulin-dependent 3',5'-cyclic nucleotide phosphodiesterase 1A-like n=1 Tax=Elgaria multicarinata webbii TaxID=159646 RepID=UPI002FCD0BCE